MTDADLEHYQAMTNDELYEELFRIHDQLRQKIDAVPDTPANAQRKQRVRKVFAEVTELVDALRRRRTAK